MRHYEPTVWYTICQETKNPSAQDTHLKHTRPADPMALGNENQCLDPDLQ
jgi:hypothetical protein